LDASLTLGAMLTEFGGCVGGRCAEAEGSDSLVLFLLRQKEGASAKSFNPRPLIGPAGGDLDPCILIGWRVCPANENKAKTEMAEM